MNASISSGSIDLLDTGEAWPGSARPGEARRCKARQGKETNAINMGGARVAHTDGGAGQGVARLGKAWHGKVNAPLTGRGFDPVPLRAWHGWAWQDWAWQRKARQGKAMKLKQGTTK